MTTIIEIEAAIEKLPAPQMDELAGWLEALRVRRATPLPVENWLQRAVPLVPTPRQQMSWTSRVVKNERVSLRRGLTPVPLVCTI